ncbi:MAG: hypothetical protein J1G01_00195 [Clostridiales bacterium]|nr:hypothetical protein [Clostridiales bacterium]
MSTQDEILDAVLKRACGYAAQEIVEEYAVVDGSLELVKRKVTIKDVPPDIAAAKFIFDSNGVSDLTDEQLEKEKKRLLEELLQSDNKDKQ